MTFTDEVAPQFATIALATAGGQPEEIPSRVEGAVVIADVPADAVAPDEGPAPWQLLYRVVSGDGHPISGTIDFTVTAPTTTPSANATATKTGTTEPAASAEAPTPPPVAADLPTASAMPDPLPDEPSVAPWGWLAGATALPVLLLAGAGGIAVTRKRQADET